MRYKIPRLTGVLLAHTTISDNEYFPGNEVGMVLGPECIRGSERSQSINVLVMKPTPEHGGYDEVIVEARVIDEKLRLATSDEVAAFLAKCPARYVDAVNKAQAKVDKLVSTGEGRFFTATEQYKFEKLLASRIEDPAEAVVADVLVDKKHSDQLYMEEAKNWAMYVYPLPSNATAAVINPAAPAIASAE
jgi:hypothetical protein